MASKMLETWKQWIVAAQEDLRLARTLLDEQRDFYPPICFNSQQAVEKALKAFLYFHRVDEEFRSHHLDMLLVRCKEIDLTFDELREPVAILDQYYIPTRYPDALAGMTASGVYHEEEAREAVEYAEKILEFVMQRLKK